MGMSVACYTRVSTAKQNLDRQLTSTKQYAGNRLGADLADLEIYRDKATGTSTSPREDYQRLMEDIEADDVDAVVAHEVSRVLGPSPIWRRQPTGFKTPE